MKLQGAAKHALSERRDDLYETPECAVHALLNNIKIDEKDIWEPCAGRGAISRVLKSKGFNVIASDLVPHEGRDNYIETGIDFLMESKTQAEIIITNPPYKLADKFIRHGLALGCRVIVLQRLMAIEGKNRSDIIDNHLRSIYAGIERLPMMHRDGWEGKKTNSSGAPFAWFDFRPYPLITPITLHRISWRTG